MTVSSAAQSKDRRKHETSGSVKNKERGKNKSKNKNKNKPKKNPPAQDAQANVRLSQHFGKKNKGKASASAEAQLEAQSPAFTSDPCASSQPSSNTHLKFRPTVSDLDNLEQAYEKVEGLWKDDGTVVIIAQNHVFRVYRGILTDHSGFFRHLFSSPPSLSTSQSQVYRGEVYDGVPVLRLDTNWEDLSNFLRVLMDRVFYSQRLTPKLTASETSHTFLTSLLRASATYNAPDLEDEVLRSLAAHFYPYAFSQSFDSLSQTWSSSLALSLAHNTGITAEATVDLIRTVREFTGPSAYFLLPVAYYNLAIKPVKTIVNAFMLPTDDSDSGWDTHWTKCINRKGDINDLSFVLEGRERLIRRQRDSIWHVKRSKRVCHLACYDAWIDFLDSSVGRHILGSPDIFAVLSDKFALVGAEGVAEAMAGTGTAIVTSLGPGFGYGDGTVVLGSVCETFVSCLRDQFPAAAKFVWGELPAYFRLGSWEELADARHEKDFNAANISVVKGKKVPVA